MGQSPTVGRMVHYQSYGTPGGEFKSEPRAAIITEVTNKDTDEVSLCIMNPTGLFFSRCIPFSAEPKAGCWSWPQRV